MKNKETNRNKETSKTDKNHFSKEAQQEWNILIMQMKHSNNNRNSVFTSN